MSETSTKAKDGVLNLLVWIATYGTGKSKKVFGPKSFVDCIAEVLTYAEDFAVHHTPVWQTYTIGLASNSEQVFTQEKVRGIESIHPTVRYWRYNEITRSKGKRVLDRSHEWFEDSRLNLAQLSPRSVFKYTAGINGIGHVYGNKLCDLVEEAMRLATWAREQNLSSPIVSDYIVVTGKGVKEPLVILERAIVYDSGTCTATCSYWKQRQSVDYMTMLLLATHHKEYKWGNTLNCIYTFVE